jgi:hypothetical protein
MIDFDLHGLTVDEALKAFVEFYNRHVQRGSREGLRVVHGWGASGAGGKIRTQLRQLLAEAVPNLDWKAGEDVEANLGVTIVYPRSIIQPRENQLLTSILDFCSTPRTESKIAGQFRKYSPREIKHAIRLLVRRREMKEIFKGEHAVYVRL